MITYSKDGTTNEKLQKEITRRWGIKSLVYYDREHNNLKLAGTFKFATVKELKLTIGYLEHYPLAMGVHFSERLRAIAKATQGASICHSCSVPVNGRCPERGNEAIPIAERLCSEFAKGGSNA